MVMYTTNAIESLNYSLRKLLKNRGAFPNDESICKVLYLALPNAANKWTMPIHDGEGALNQFVIRFGRYSVCCVSFVQLLADPEPATKPAETSLSA